MHEVRFFIVPEQLRGGDALDLGVKNEERSSNGTAAPSRKRECRRPP